MKYAKMLVIFLFVTNYGGALERTNVITYNEVDMYGKYFDSATPNQIFNDVKQYLPNVHKNRTIRTIKEIDISSGVRGQPREIQYIINESINHYIANFYDLRTYTLTAYLWFDNNNAGYIWFHMTDGGLGGNRLFYYVLNTPQSSAPPPPSAPTPSPSQNKTLETWINDKGQTVVVITNEQLYIAENILPWGKLSKSGHLPTPQNGLYQLRVNHNDRTAWDSLGNGWGGYRIDVSFFVNAEGTLVVTIANSAYNVVDNLGDFAHKQTLYLRKKSVGVNVPSAQPTAFKATHSIKTNDGSNLRLRSEPSTKGTQIDSLDNGSYVQVLETGEKFVDRDGYTGNWMRIRTQNNKTGWCFGAYLIKTDAQQ